MPCWASLFLTATLLDAKRAEAIARERVKIPNDEDAYYDAIEGLIAGLVGTAPKMQDEPVGPVQKVEHPMAVEPAQSQLSAEPKLAEPDRAQYRTQSLGARFALRVGGWTADKCPNGGCGETDGEQYLLFAEYRWRHHPQFAVRARAGTGYMELPGPDDEAQIYLSLGEQFEMPLAQ